MLNLKSLAPFGTVDENMFFYNSDSGWWPVRYDSLHPAILEKLMEKAAEEWQGHPDIYPLIDQTEVSLQMRIEPSNDAESISTDINLYVMYYPNKTRAYVDTNAFTFDIPFTSTELEQIKVAFLEGLAANMTKRRTRTPELQSSVA